MYERDYLDYGEGLTVCIEQDGDAANPREDFEHLGTMVCWHRRHTLGDEQPDCSPDEFWLRVMQEREQSLRGRCPPDHIEAEHVRQYIATHFYVLPLYLHDHSGISISTGRFSCAWDSGQVGWIYLSRDTAEKETFDPLGLLESEVAEYDQYLRGDVWGFSIEDENGVQLYSCWGFYGRDYCESEARDVAKSLAEERNHDYVL
jgi:hypothetical protein